MKKAIFPLFSALLAFLLAACMSDEERATREDKVWKDYQDKTSSLSPPPHCDEIPAVKLAKRGNDRNAWVRAMMDCHGRHDAEARAVYEGAMLDLSPDSANKREREFCLGIPGKKWKPMSPVDLRHCISLSAEGRRGLREDEAWRAYQSALPRRNPPIECWIESFQPKDASVPERVDNRLNTRVNTDCEARAYAEARAAYRRTMLDLAPDLAARRAREICFDDIREAQSLTSPAELHNCVSKVGRP